MTTPPKPARRESHFQALCSGVRAERSGAEWRKPHLSPQRDALGELLDGQLVVAVALLGRAAELADDAGGGDDDDDEEAQAVDEDLQVRLRGQRRGGQLCRKKRNKQ